MPAFDNGSIVANEGYNTYASRWAPVHVILILFTVHAGYGQLDNVSILLTGLQMHALLTCFVLYLRNVINLAMSWDWCYQPDTGSMYIAKCLRNLRTSGKTCG